MESNWPEKQFTECPNCGELPYEGTAVAPLLCPACGRPVLREMTCKFCDEEVAVDPTTMLCPVCGHDVKGDRLQQMNGWVLLLLILGLVGASVSIVFVLMAYWDKIIAITKP